MSRDHAYIAIAGIEGVAIQLGAAMNLETMLADERALVKHAGIQRLLDARTFTSVSAAEKGIEFDQLFMEHRGKERAAVADRILWEAKLKAAQLRAQLAVTLCAASERGESPYGDLVTEREKELETVLERIDDMLDKAGVQSQGSDGLFLSVPERIELLLSRAAQGVN